MPYILHPIQSKSNEEAGCVLPLLLIIGVLIGGPIHLLMVFFTHDETLPATGHGQKRGPKSKVPYAKRFESRLGHPLRDFSSAPFPGSYPFEVSFSVDYGPRSNLEDPHTDYGYQRGSRSPSAPSFSRSGSALSYSDASVASVPYSTKHWRAGEIRGDRVARPRHSVHRAVNMLQPKPKLDVLPDRKEGKTSHASPRRGKSSPASPWRLIGKRQALDSEGSIEMPRSAGSLSDGSPGVGRKVASSQSPLAPSQSPLVKDSSDHTSPLLNTTLRFDQDVADCIIDMTSPPTQGQASDFVLDSLLAMLLPHVVPGIKIGPDVKVANDAERDLIDEFEDYQLRLARSGEWFSFTQDRSRSARGTESHNKTLGSSSMSKSGPTADGTPSTSKESSKSRTKWLPSFHSMRAGSTPSRASVTAALQLPPTMRPFKPTVKISARIKSPRKGQQIRPRPTSSLLTGFPSSHLSSAYAMLECRDTPPEVVPQFRRVVSDEQRLNGGVPHASAKCNAKLVSATSPDRKMRSSISKTVRHRPSVVGDSQQPGPAESSCLQDAQGQDDQLELLNQSLDSLSHSVHLDPATAAPTQSTPKGLKRDETAITGASSPTGTQKLAVFNEGHTDSPQSARTRKAWNTLPAAIPLQAKPGVASSLQAQQVRLTSSPDVAHGDNVTPCSPATSRKNDASPCKSTAEVPPTSAQHANATPVEIVQSERQEQAARNQPSSIATDVAEDSTRDLVQPLAHDVLHAFAKGVIEGWKAPRQSSPGESSKENVDPGSKQEQDHLLSPVSVCFSAAASDHRRSLGSSLGLSADASRASSRRHSPVRGQLTLPDAATQFRSSISPSEASSTSRRKSLGSEFGLSDIVQGCETDETRPTDGTALNNDGGHQELLAASLTTAEKRSTGGSNRTTESSCLSSELVLSPVGSLSIKSPTSAERDKVAMRSTPPDSPLKQQARQQGFNVWNERQFEDAAGTAGHAPKPGMDVRQMGPLQAHMYLHPHLDLRLPTLEEVSEEASMSASGPSSEVHQTQARCDGEWGLLSQELDRIYRSGRVLPQSPPCSNDKPLDNRVLAAVHRRSHAVYQSVPPIPTSTGWLHVVQRQTSILAVESRQQTVLKDRNGSGCSTSTTTMATPQKKIGLRTDFWMASNHPLPPLPFDLVSKVANGHARRRHSTLEDATELPWLVGPPSRRDSRCSDVWSQASELEMIDRLDDQQRVSAEMVRNTPQKLQLPPAMSRAVEWRKSTQTLLQRRQAMSSLLGFAKGISELPENGRHTTGTDLSTDAEAVIASRSPPSSVRQSAQWHLVESAGKCRSRINSSEYAATLIGESDEIREELALKAEIEQIVLGDLERRALSTRGDSATKQARDTLDDYYLGGQQRAVAVARQQKSPRLAPRSGQKLESSFAGDDSDRTLPARAGPDATFQSVRTLPSLNDSLPSDLTLQAISARSGSTVLTSPSLTIQEDARLDAHHVSASDCPLSGRSQASHRLQPTEWPSSTPARATHLSQMPEVEGSFLLLASLSPRCEKGEDKENQGVNGSSSFDYGKKRGPRLSEAHLHKPSHSPLLRQSGSTALSVTPFDRTTGRPRSPRPLIASSPLSQARPSRF